MLFLVIISSESCLIQYSLVEDTCTLCMTSVKYGPVLDALASSGQGGFMADTALGNGIILCIYHQKDSLRALFK